ncbi:DNA-processing protein DprA [Bermanella marisrubri]|uniref:SMF protein n=1 Tax=Bermanella marisrubri TaxID=207949 RepID=Q1MY05_9GAMM|nr:DNA-processing protein DprA [Bermanella marisrubri]EAT10891.1 SMF protein [Oceanobacter sp. RED65] [Bermanella marisrubri]
MHSKEYWKNETIAFLALANIKGVGFRTLQKIASNGLGFKSILKSDSKEELQKHIKAKIDPNKSWHDFQLEAWAKGIELARELSAQQTRLIFLNEECYPPLLKKIPDPPYWLFVQGNLDSLNEKPVAIVGTRKPNEDGILLTSIAVAGIASKNRTIISGLADGIDQTAHKAALKYNLKTVAVLGNGLSIDYPAGSEKLKSEIINSGGAIVTEYLPNQTYSAENFVKRNRIQAGLSETIIPAQWKVNSGTGHTVNFAIKYDRKIAGLKLPNQFHGCSENEYIISANGQVFELPIETREFLHYLDQPRQPIQAGLEI